LRLSRIKLAGFKSFVDPTDIPIPGDLVGIVGPNGCGKSNVIDAVRWVLGESKASSLRGESMQDVIFSGSANRKPVGRASVELVFDNSLGKAAGQWSSYAEIAIKRVLQRDGDSTYYINNLHVRRRDIADLFLGTGLGGRGYAIIEQGMISRIIEAKPEELRLFLEEAAGVSKYRERRRETEARLSDTRENLLRVDDVRQELEKQLLHLDEQAKVASHYKALQGEMHTAQNLLWLARKQDAVAQRGRAEKDIARLEIELEAETACLRDAEKRLEAKRGEHFAQSDALHAAQGDLYAANAEVARIEQEIAHLRDNRDRVTRQMTAAQYQITSQQSQLVSQNDNLQRWRSERERALAAHQAHQEKAVVENAKLPLAETDYRARRDQFNEAERGLLLAQQSLQLEETHRAHAEKALQQFDLRRQRLGEEIAHLPQADVEALSGLQRDSEAAAVALKQKQDALAEMQAKLPLAEAARSEAARQLRASEQTATQLDARLNALQRLQQRLVGSGGSEQLTAWLNRQLLQDHPRLWQGLEIEKGWEDALEAVLRERLNSTQFDTLDAAKNWNNTPPPGKWSLFEAAQVGDVGRASARQDAEGEVGLSAGYRASPIKPDLQFGGEDTLRSKDGKMPLLWYLTCRDASVKPVLEEWLDGVFVVEDIAEGLLERGKLLSGEILVTRKGDIFSRHSLTYYAPDSELHGVLARSREIAEILADVNGLKARLQHEKAALNAADEVCRELEAAMSQSRQQGNELQQAQHDLAMRVLKLTQTIERSNQRRGQIETELVEIGQQMLLESEQKTVTEQKLAEQQSQIAGLRASVEAARHASGSAEQALHQQREQAQAAARQVQEAAFYEKTCAGKIAEVELAIGHLDESIGELQAQLQALQAEVVGFDEAERKRQLQEWLAQRGAREQALAAARNALEAAAFDLRGIEAERITAEQKLDPLRESIHQARLRENEARFTEEQFAEQLLQAQADIEALLPQLGKQRPAALQGEINRCNAEIEALGAVNLAALEELQTASERKNYLDKQSQDLKEAVETLEAAIRRIDRETRERLMETFDRVNEHLGEMFPAMFGGGHAKLVLSGEEILDAGVQIIAQPPGKKTTSIHLLSGGEKALTALSLVFSLFKLTPAPFCMLDEVDAPLDDTNTERFCELVKKMAEHTQILYISHNKITMEMAQQLIGVTMQEQGVSRVVAVDIEEAVRMSEDRGQRTEDRGRM